MTLLCRTFGHAPARSTVQRDPTTFTLHAQCKRCRAAIAHERVGWEAQLIAGATGL